MRKLSANTALESALKAASDALEHAGAPFMMIGGIAVIAHGVKRLTTDVDAVVEGASADLKLLLRAFAREKVAPRIPQVEAFARENLVLLMEHTPTGVELDVSLGFTSFELEALKARRPIRFGKISVPMARAEDLVIFKALAARPKDVEDAVTLLILHRDIDLERVRRRVAELAAAAEAPELIDGLEAIIDDAGGASTRPRGAKSKRSARQQPTATRTASQKTKRRTADRARKPSKTRRR